MDKMEIGNIIKNTKFPATRQRPGLMFGVEDIPAIRKRFDLHAGMRERATTAWRELLRTPVGEITQYTVNLAADEALSASDGYLLTGDSEYADWSKERIEALLAMDTWIYPLHTSCKYCDHVMANVGALVALACDQLGTAMSEADMARVADGLRRHLLLPFLNGTGTEPEWWYQPEYLFNWKIMTCGEAGFAACAFADRWPEATEAMARAARGVIEILDCVPPEGDWPEGVGYWFETLFMGLRFAWALRRASGGAVNLLAHPALAVTGDFAAMLTTPGGRVFNFNDNSSELSRGCAEGLAILAVEHRREDWMAVARRFAPHSAVFLALDDPAFAGQPLARELGYFPGAGVVTMRGAGGHESMFVGFKCGPSDVGHAHLDAGSFIVESHGAPLVIDEGTWPYSIPSEFFDMAGGRRWNFDGCGTIGHGTLLVDGQGQTWGAGRAGRILAARGGPDYHITVGDASAAYPNLLKKFMRTLLFLKPDCLVVRDVVECEGERHVEWLLHYAGAIRSEGLVSIIENEGVSLAVTPFLPDRKMGWRWSDVVRTSMYEANGFHEVTKAVRYRGFSGFHAVNTVEFLFGLRVKGSSKGGDWQFAGGAGSWTLRAAGSSSLVRPDADTLTVD